MDLVPALGIFLLVFVTSVFGVVTGGNSLINVPVMIFFNLPPKVAVGTNMVGLTFLSFSGASRFFLSRDRLPLPPRRFLVIAIALTLLSSAVGAWMAADIGNEALRRVISVFLLLISAFMLVKDRFPITRWSQHAAAAPIGYLVILLWGIYGGFFSGGYVTVLTFLLVLLWNFSLLESVAATKIINLFSSLIASVVFAFRGLVLWQMAIPIILAMLAGGWVGAHLAMRRGEGLIRRLFAVVVTLLAIKLLFF